MGAANEEFAPERRRTTETSPSPTHVEKHRPSRPETALAEHGSARPSGPKGLPAARRPLGTGPSGLGGLPYHPTDADRFSFFSHSSRGRKYFADREPSIARSPVTASRASGQGRLAPISSIALSRFPASFWS